MFWGADLLIFLYFLTVVLSLVIWYVRGMLIRWNPPSKQSNIKTAEVPIQLNSLVVINAIQVYPSGSFQAKDGRPAQQGASLHPLSSP